jgi:hypothetical protein
MLAKKYINFFSALCHSIRYQTKQKSKKKTTNLNKVVSVDGVQNVRIAAKVIQHLELRFGTDQHAAQVGH